MGVGYVLGCLASILFWKLDRTAVVCRLNGYVRKIVRNDFLIQIIYISFILVTVVALEGRMKGEISNFITAFLVIDISNTERKSLNLGDKTHFYDSISITSKSLVCGFIAPLFFILLLGDSYSLAYMMIYHLNFTENYNILRVIFSILTIVPALLTQFFLYIIYLTRNRKIKIDFKGDYLLNCMTRPLLNIDIMGAYIESVNFYFYFNEKDMHYIKSYGGYTNRIDYICVKDYLSISYGISLLCFVIFFVLIRL